MDFLKVSICRSTKVVPYSATQPERLFVLSQKYRQLSANFQSPLKSIFRPDPVNDPALVARADDNFRFIDLSVPGATKPLSDVDLILQTHPQVSSSKTGTVSFTCSDYPTAYRTLYSILGQIYERDIENMVDDLAVPKEYARPDLESIIGRDYPLNEIEERRKAAS